MKNNVLILAGGVWGFISDSLYNDLTFDNAVVLFPSKLVGGLVSSLGITGMPSVGYTILTVAMGGLFGWLAGYALSTLRK